MQNDDFGVLIRNTRSMDMQPRSPDEYASLEDGYRGEVELMPTFTGRAFSRAVAYGVIVEMWEKTKFGRVRREFHKAFTQAERNKIGRYHGRFYRWLLVSGVPDRVTCRMGTLELLRRAVAFFASV